MKKYFLVSRTNDGVIITDTFPQRIAYILGIIFLLIMFIVGIFISIPYWIILGRNYFSDVININ